jgi:hypothetical protein
VNRSGVEEWANIGANEMLAQMDAVDMNVTLVAALMRAAYGQGYVDAHSESEPLTTDQAVRNREMLLLKLPV